MKKEMPWAFPRLDACDFLNISEEGPWGASPSLSFYPFLIFDHHLDPRYLKTSVADLHLKIGKIHVYSANPWIDSFAHTVYAEISQQYINYYKRIQT